MNKADRTQNRAMAQCDEGAWLCLLSELRREETSLIMLDTVPRYALHYDERIWGPTLSRTYVANLVRDGVLEKRGQYKYALKRKWNDQ